MGFQRNCHQVIYVLTYCTICVGSLLASKQVFSFCRSETNPGATINCFPFGLSKPPKRVAPAENHEKGVAKKLYILM